MKQYICKCGAEAEPFVTAWIERAVFGVDCPKCIHLVKCSTRAEADRAWLKAGCRIETR